jgi:hypothetical protein
LRANFAGLWPGNTGVEPTGSVKSSVPSQALRTVGGMNFQATIRILCEANPSLGTSVVNGLLAWAGVLGGFTVFFSGLPAAVALFVPSRSASLARRINRGLGIGFFVGMLLGFLMLFVFVAKPVS